jgi:hypothetical protein
VMVGCSYVVSSVLASVGCSSSDIHFEIIWFAFKVSFRWLRALRVKEG